MARLVKLGPPTSIEGNSLSHVLMNGLDYLANKCVDVLGMEKLSHGPSNMSLSLGLIPQMCDMHYSSLARVLQ